MPKKPFLNESNIEALIIRWRRLLILGIVDYLRGENEYNKIIVKDLLDMAEGFIKMFLKDKHGVIISRIRSDGTTFWLGLRDIENNLSTYRISPKEKRNVIEFIGILFEGDINSLRNIRNNETHMLNLSEIPVETTYRVWRLFYSIIETLDIEIINYAKERPETNGFYNLYPFFKQVVLDSNRVGIDLSKLKHADKLYSKVEEEYFEVNTEKGEFKVIENIMEGSIL